MGNQHSSSAEGERGRAFARHVGSLGLSRSELDKRCQPSGLYDSCLWEDKAIRKLVAEGRVASRLKGAEYRTNDSEQECPICFLYYVDVNVTKCCSATICTECFLQVRPQKEKQSTCPFCNCNKLQVSVAKKPSEDDIQSRNKDEQMVMEARIRGANTSTGLQYDSRSSGISDHETTTAAVKKKNSASVAPNSPCTSGFGSQLEKDERFQLLKKRSESFASNEGNRTPQADKESIKAIAMTPEERRRLEAEMRAQHSHPLTLQIEAEARQRILQNEQIYNTNNPGTSANTMGGQRAAELFRGSSGGRRLRHRVGAPRDWNSIVDAFERGGNGEVGTLDDLVVLEAAILLSMEEEARRSRDGDGFDAERHARDGFPLVRSFLSGQASANNLRRAEDLDRGGGSTASSSSAAIQDLTRSLSSGQRRNESALSTAFGGATRYFRGMGDTALETASMMMRGISEEEQIAMAIAASLQEHGSTQNTEDSDLSIVGDTNGIHPVDGSDGQGLQIESLDRESIDVVMNESSSAGEVAHISGEVSMNPPPLNARTGNQATDVAGDEAPDSAGGEASDSAGDEAPDSAGDEATTITELARVVTDTVADRNSNSNGQADDSSQAGSSTVASYSLEAAMSASDTHI